MLRAWANINGLTNNSENILAPYTTNGSSATAVLLNHGYMIGHVIYVSSISGGNLTVGVYVITQTTYSTFSFATTALAGSGNLNIQRMQIRASEGIHSVTRDTTGVYTANFTTEMPDTNYCCSGLIRKDNDVQNAYVGIHTFSTTPKRKTSFTFNSVYISNFSTTGNFDSPEINLAVFR